MLFYSSVNAQVVGQIFTKEEANKLYGPVKESLSIPITNLEIILNKTDEYVMLNIIDKKLFILNSKREVLYPYGDSVKDDQVFYYFSKGAVESSLKYFEKKQNAQIEIRKDVLSITYGEFTLEFVALYPPICP